MRRVVITGVGLVAPTGRGPEAFWTSLIEGRSAIAPLTRFDASTYPCRVGGQVPDHAYIDLIEARQVRTTAHVTQLALAAGQLARNAARLGDGWYPPERRGVAIGTALGGWRDAEQQYGVLLERGARRVNPFVANGAPNHAPGAELASALGAQGPQLTFSNGCPASLQAIGAAASAIATDELDMCLAGGTESPFSALVFAGMSRTLELSTLNDPPERASRPFDESHAGIVLSEGSCILTLEAAEHAERRGVPAMAELLGMTSSCDARGLYGFDPTGYTGARAIHRLLAVCERTPNDVDYVCAHANSSPAFDRKETLVVKAAFGERAAQLPVSSIKAVLGHPFGASGAFQAAAAVLALQEQTIPPTHHLERPDAACDLDYVPRTARAARLRTVLITSYGYGGVNAYLLLAEPRP